MTETAIQYVAVVASGYDDGVDTYVLPGTVTLDDAFKLINDRRLMHKASKLSLHIDSMSVKNPLDRLFGTESEAPESVTVDD